MLSGEKEHCELRELERDRSQGLECVFPRFVTTTVTAFVCLFWMEIGILSYSPGKGKMQRMVDPQSLAGLACAIWFPTYPASLHLTEFPRRGRVGRHGGVGVAWLSVALKRISAVFECCIGQQAHRMGVVLPSQMILLRPWRQRRTRQMADCWWSELKSQWEVWHQARLWPSGLLREGEQFKAGGLPVVCGAPQ